MRRRRRLNRRVAPPSHERWLVSYADFITLMFAFFTVLYASSTVDARKMMTVVDSMQRVFDSQGAPPPAAPPAEKHIAPPLLDPPGANLLVVRASLQSDLASEIAQGRVARRTDAAAWSCRSRVGQLHHRQLGLASRGAAGDLDHRRPSPRHPEYTARRRAYGRRADPDVEVRVELGTVNRAGDASGRLPDYRRAHRADPPVRRRLFPVPSESAERLGREPGVQPPHRHRDPQYRHAIG